MPGRFPRRARRAAGLARARFPVLAGVLAILLDYANATSFDRNSAAPNQDHRGPGNGGTGEYEWAYVAQAGTDWREAEETAPADITSWTDIGTPTEVTGIADPFGGTGAVTTGDDDGAGFEGHTYVHGALVIWRLYRSTTWVKKQTVQSYPEFQNVATGFAHWQINTLTGAAVIRTQSGWKDVSLTVTAGTGARTGWWKCVLKFRPSGAAALTQKVYPALAASLGGGSSAAETGELTWYPPIVVDGEAAWLPPNVPVIYSDGAVRIEGARENGMPESSLDTWVAESGASVSTDDATAPDSAANADTITFSASAASRLRHITTIASGASSDGTDAMVSCWLRAVSGTEEARIGLRHKDGTTELLSSDLTLTTTPMRFFFYVADIGTGGASPAGIIVNSTDAAARSIEAWGFQVEHEAKFASSDIRTAGAAETQNKDDMRFSAGNWPDRMANGKFSITYWPEFDSADNATGGRIVGILATSGTTRQFDIRYTGTVWQVRFFNSAGSSTISLDGGAAAWSAGDMIVFTLDHVSGETSAEINGGAAQTGSTGAAGGSWDNGTKVLYIAGKGSVNHCFGALSQPRAA